MLVMQRRHDRERQSEREIKNIRKGQHSDESERVWVNRSTHSFFSCFIFGGLSLHLRFISFRIETASFLEQFSPLLFVGSSNEKKPQQRTLTSRQDCSLLCQWAAIVAAFCVILLVGTTCRTEIWLSHDSAQNPSPQPQSSSRPTSAEQREEWNKKCVECKRKVSERENWGTCTADELVVLNIICSLWLSFALCALRFRPAWLL